MKNPWFPFYHSDWISGTRRLSPTCRAIYLDILCMIYAAGGPVIRDEKGMARECAVTLGTFIKSLDELINVGKLLQEGNTISNEKAMKSIKKAEQKSNSSSFAAKHRWGEKDKENQHLDDANALRTHDERICETNATTTTTTTREEIDTTNVVSSDNAKTAISDWNDLAGECGLSKAQHVTEKRLKHLKARLFESGGIDGWRVCLAKIRESPFLLGQTSKWKCSFDFLISQSGFTKILEGNYDESTNHGPNGRRNERLGLAEITARRLAEIEADT